jgi:hypothetical protein
MTSLTEGQHNGEFIVTESDGSLSRDTITVLSGQTLQAGHVLGQVTVGTASAAPASGNTGNGVISGVAAGTTAEPGVYIAECIEHATNSGTFQVTDPTGIIVGDVVVGAAFAGPVHFTIADGATDFVAGDRFLITVAAGSGKYKEYNPANTDGSETAVAISYANVDASAGDTEAVIIARNAEVNAAELIWFAGATSDQITAGLAQLKTYNLLAR